MAEKILGLDIGDDSLKAVLLSRGFRGGYGVSGAKQVAVGGPEGLEGALQALFADSAFRGLTCLTTLPARQLSFRSLRLPFKDDRRIRQALPFALEPLIQTPVEEVFIDFAARPGAAGKTEIFAALAPRALVNERVALLKPHVRETAVIDVGAVPLALQLARRRGEETLLLLDVGARSATAVFARGGSILHVRRFPFGGAPLEGAAAEEKGSAICALGERLGAELKSTEASLLWQGALPEAPARLLLTGGGTKRPGFTEALAARVAVPCEQADLAAAAGIRIEEPLRKGWDPAVMDQALALAARPMGKGYGFNFRQRASEARAGYGEVRQLLKKGGAVAAVLAFLGLVEMGLGSYGDRLRLEVLKRDVRAEFKKIDPEATRIVDPVAQLKGKIAETRKIAAGLNETTGGATLLDLLREISQLAGDDLLVTALAVDGKAFSLKGQARNFDSVDAIKKAFANGKIIQSVTIDSTQMLKEKEGEGVEFDLKGVLKR